VKIFCILFLLYFFAGCTFSHHSPQPTERLYIRLGGEKVITAIVDDLINRLLSDERVSHFYRDVDTVRLKQLWSEYLCWTTGGRCAYTGRNMAITHKNLDIKEAHYYVFHENLRATLDKLQIPITEYKGLTSALSMKQNIVDPKRDFDL
jgi:hemoglobin